MLSVQARIHLIGALVVVALAGLCWSVLIGSEVHRPGTRVFVLFGGLLVTLVLLLRDVRDRAVLLYGLGFFAAFALFVTVL